MFSKSTLFLAFVAVAEFARASPPGCMLAAVNTVKEPWNMKNVCQTKDIAQTMAKLCGDNTKEALSAFADLCNKQVDVKVATDLPTTTGSSKPTGTGNSTASVTGTPSVVVYTTASFDSSCSCTKTAAVTSTAVAGVTGIATSAKGTATGTGGGAPLHTGAAAAKMGAGFLALALGGVGAVAAAL